MTIKQWGEADFFNAREIWNDLLGRSSGDPLFLSWEWQYTWWETFSRALPLELLLLAAYNDKNELVGIAPLFRNSARIRNILTSKRIQFIGNCWRGPATIRTEHLDFIARSDVHGTVVRCFIYYLLQNQGWDDFVLNDLNIASPTYQVIRETTDARDVIYIRQAETYGSYYVETNRSFTDYIAERGRNTRLQMHGRRKYLQSMGDVSLVMASINELDEYFDLLNDLHRRRWGAECFVGARITFNRRLVERMTAIGKLHFSVLTLNGTPLSALYNFCAGRYEYNIQGGFDERFDKKLALGFLHLGYVMEQAFESKDTDRFFLLAGGGKRTPYKERLTRTRYDMADIQIIRKKVLKTAYRIYDSVL